MEVAMKKKCTVVVAVEQRPDKKGLRIRLVRPTGVYISSEDAAAALWWFEAVTQKFLITEKFLTPAGGEAVMCTTSDEWNKVREVGTGTMTFACLNADETAALVMTSERVITPPVKPLHLEWWSRSKGTSFCIGADDELRMDKWLVDAAMSDEYNLTETIQ